MYLLIGLVVMFQVSSVIIRCRIAVTTGSERFRFFKIQVQRDSSKDISKSAASIIFILYKYNPVAPLNALIDPCYHFIKIKNESEYVSIYNFFTFLPNCTNVSLP
jgi:hypothetical protein